MKSVIIFASGQGSNAEAIIQYFRNNPKVKIALLVCNNPLAGAVGLTEKYQIPLLLIDKISFNKEEFINSMIETQPDLIVLAGFLWKIPEALINSFPNKIINLHPALLPKYGGKGMYGRRVHEAVKTAGEKESGITIHYVNTQYDEGAILLQAHCPIYVEDSPDDIAGRIHNLEYFFLPRSIEYLLLSEG